MGVPEPREVLRAGRVLLDALAKQAQADVRTGEALRTMTTWLRSELDRLESGVGEAEPRRSEVRPPSNVDPDVIRQRCLLKARACRWAGERRRALARGDDPAERVRPRDEQLTQEARQLPDCYLWMLTPYQSLPDDERLDLLASAYENAALAASLALRSEDGDEAMQLPVTPDLYRLIAESQSSLFACLRSADVASDRDQQDLFGWLRDRTARDRVFIDRYMKRTDPAPFHEPDDLRRRLEGYGAECERRGDTRRRRGQLVNRIRYHLEQMRDDSLDSSAHHWLKLSETMTEWVAGGLDEHDEELCRLLADAEVTPPPEVVVTDEATRILDAAQRMSRGEGRSE